MQENEIPSVNSYWSFTMYQVPALFLVKKPIDRYLINSPMLPNLNRNADGSITLYLRHESPGEEDESNWLLALDGLFIINNRLYYPKEEAFYGTCKPIPLVGVQ